MKLSLELKKIIQQDPKNLNAFLYMGFLYSKLDRDDDAIAVYEEVLSFEKEKPEVYFYLSTIYIHKKDYAKAEKILKDAITRFENNDDLNFNLAIVYEKAKRFDEMTGYLKRAIEINPKHAEALNYLGYSYAEKGINLE